MPANIGLLGTYETKEEAVRTWRGEARCRDTEHAIHNQDGTLGERNSYGRDPVEDSG
jgi:hypothetical protein